MPSSFDSDVDRRMRAVGVIHKTEELLATVSLALMMLLPLAEIVIRPFFAGGIPGSIPFVEHLTLWVGFIGACVAARSGKLIALASATFIPEGIFRTGAQTFSATVGAMVSALLAWAALDVVAIEMEFGREIALGIPSWVFQLVLPVAFGCIAWRLAWGAGSFWPRVVSILGLIAGIWFAQSWESFDGAAGWPWVVLLVLAAIAGAPIFSVLAGAAAFLYMVDAFDPANVPLFAYDLATEPHLPSIPLFTLTGFILAQGNSSERLLRVFRAVTGWMPGGTAVVCAVVCAFFTVFTGGSGVTILALGGLLLPALLKDG
ncbi:TRAP transporter small permease subunit, partial [bacterium]